MFRQLSEASLGQRVSPEGRTLGFLAWHITVTIPEMLNRAGLAVDGAADGHAPVPSSAGAIVAAYRSGRAIGRRSDSRPLDRRNARRDARNVR